MESVIRVLALNKGLENIQQFALKAGIPWSLAANIWTGDISNKSLKTLNKAARALDCSIEDLFVEERPNDNL